jgi:hypothetical protein
MKGDPSSRIADIENVEIVFKDGVDTICRKLLDSVTGHYGEFENSALLLLAARLSAGRATRSTCSRKE